MGRIKRYVTDITGRDLVGGALFGGDGGGGGNLEK